MRLAPFITVSIALHAGALVHPIAFRGWRAEPPIEVTILPIETDAGGGGGNGDQRRNPIRAAPAQASRTKRTEQPVPESIATNEAVAHPSAIEDSTKTTDADVVLSGLTPRAEVSSAENGKGSADHGRGTGGNGLGSNGTGSGSGSAPG